MRDGGAAGVSLGDSPRGLAALGGESVDDSASKAGEGPGGGRLGALGGESIDDSDLASKAGEGPGVGRLGVRTARAGLAVLAMPSKRERLHAAYSRAA